MRATSLKQIIDHHFNGGEFQYESYDHAKSEAEFKTTSQFKDMLNEDWGFRENSKIDKMIIPEEMRDKYAIMKTGKLRSIDFNPQGDIRFIKIGNKRPMNFYEYTACKVELL